MPLQALAAVATLLSFAPHGNRIELRLDHGSAEMVWLSNSTFHFRRTLDGPLAEFPEKVADPVSVRVDELPGALRIASNYVEVTIQKHGLLLRMRKVDGTPLAADLSEPHADETGVVWERQVPAGARFYGLGPLTAPSLDLRGTAVNSAIPFLICTAGYGEYHNGSGPFRFDFTGTDRYRVEAPGVDYYFYYGPTPKEIFKERNAAGPAARSWRVPAPPTADWSGLGDSLLRMVHAAISGVLEPSFDLSAYDTAPPELRQRARQIFSLAPTVTPGTAGLSDFRRQLDAFFAAYAPEVDYHGYPTWHPLPFQFAEDPECARHADEFMLGDEMLVAPIYDATGKRSLYLPQGVWTNLDTNEVLPGRRTIAVETQSLPVFARNGTIVPLASPGGMALHYFPKLGAEFFLLEQDLGEYSQVHAAPAADIVRLEIESKKDRDYQWVVHHIDKPAEVGFEAAKYRQVGALEEMADRTWFYDAALKNLQVRVRAKAGEDCIINLAF
jgi:hypothetical protein